MTQDQHSAPKGEADYIDLPGDNARDRLIEKMARAMNIATDGHDRYWSGYWDSAAAAYKVVSDHLAATRQPPAPQAEAAPATAAHAGASEEARNLVVLDRRDLWDHVRGAIYAALNDKIPKDCVVSWAWEEATNRTMDIFQKIVDVAPTPVADSGAKPVIGEAIVEAFWTAYNKATEFKSMPEATKDALAAAFPSFASMLKQLADDARLHLDGKCSGLSPSIDAARAMLAAAPVSVDEQQAGRGLSGEELALFRDTVDQFADCHETTTDYQALMKWANAGFLECEHFTVTAAGHDLLSATTGGAATTNTGGAS
jgi:hypothetical protein